MATKRPAKIASKKKGKAIQKACPVCQTEMQITRIVRATEGPAGMLWLCTSASCQAVMSKSEVHVGSLLA